MRLWDEKVVWAQALRLVKAASLRQDRVLPRTYWKEFGGEGSVRGVKRETINIANGGRLGINLRNELRFQQGQVGLVFFWDRAGYGKRMVRLVGALW